MTTEQKLAAEFCRTLKEWLTPEQFAEMVKLNQSPDYPKDCCPSHDYCDANVAMDEAFKVVLGKHASDDLNDEHTLNLWVQAWNLATANNYDDDKCAS